MPAFRVAVVGGGPSGFYAAEALLRSQLPVAVDMFERLPVPYGLVRFGVAPDHPKLKQVSAVFHRIAGMAGFRFVGGVEVGVDLPVETLLRCYHAVILATGAAVERRLGIPGEALAGSHRAGDFVAWYNGHPDARDYRFDLSGERAVIVGHGNVALDVARLLTKTADELRHTDVAAHALEALAASRIREVHVVGRRGPDRTRFAAKELHEFGALADCDPALDMSDLPGGAVAAPHDADPETRAAVALLDAFSHSAGSKRRRCVFRFNLEPLAIEGAGRVERTVFRRTDAAAAPTAIECDLVFTSIGRRAAPMAGVPHDPARGVHANDAGRVVAQGTALPGLYTCGWSKRGPQGTIGTNRACSVETTDHVIADLARGGHEPADHPDGLIAEVAQRAGRRLDFAAWERIDAAEVERGRLVGKPREKFVTIAQLMAAAGA